MSSAFTHAFIALAAGKTCFARPMPARFWVAAVACSAGPDLDVIGFPLGIAYGDLWGHRGMTHSLSFALVAGAVVATILFRRDAPIGSRRWLGIAAFFFALTASHGFIDAFTDGGRGIAFFSPFDETRYFMPWRPLRVPHFNVAQFATPYGVDVLLREVILIWIPAAALWGAAKLWRGPEGSTCDRPRGATV